MSELKKCPFCGGYAHLDKAYIYFRDIVIYCEECDTVFTLDDCNATAEDIVNAWNKRKKMSEWIAIESKLPPECKDCLVYDGRNMFVWTLTKNRETGDLVFEDDYGYFHNVDDITHWMPLPEPPKEE